MKFLADENFPITAYKTLLASGFDIKHVAFDMHGIADTDVNTFATEESRIILTFDGDFGTLIFKLGYRPPGVIYFRLPTIKAHEPAHIVINLVKEGYKLEKMHTVVETDKIRQRPIPNK